MSNALTTRPTSDMITFNDEQLDLIKRTVAKGATDDELALFLHQCRKTGLDPLAKQIYFQKRRSKNGDQMTILTGIDGYRLTADRTGKYAGQDDPVFDNEDNPQKATVTIYKMIDGVRCAFTATARWSQYFPGDAQGFMWRKMPHLMLGKCAEALAIRKAFPAELSGVYVKEEMEQADTPAPTEMKIVSTPMLEPTKPYVSQKEIYGGKNLNAAKIAEQKKALMAIAKAQGVTKTDDLKHIHAACIGIEMAHLPAAVSEWLELQEEQQAMVDSTFAPPKQPEK